MHDTYIKPDNSRATAIGGGPVSEKAASLFCPSETMRLEITNLLKYCDFAGIDAENIIHEMKKEGLLPASDRKGGKKALAAFRSAVLQQIIE